MVGDKNELLLSHREANGEADGDLGMSWAMANWKAQRIRIKMDQKG